jgi:hypothetical protein
MGHQITAILLKGDYDDTIAKEHDLFGHELAPGITLFFINHFYSACWQAILETEGHLDRNGVNYLLYPAEKSMARLMQKISGKRKPLYAIVATDYFGGHGQQYANVYKKDRLVTRKIKTINQALAYLGVIAKEGMDEFESSGLHQFRSNPGWLEKYEDLADELGV